MEKTFKAKNNIPVYLYKSSGIHSFCIGLYIKSGSLYETEDENGLSHFFEHVTFKNINNCFDKKLADFLDRYSLDFNGCTYKEFMQFKITGISKNFKKGTQVITKVLNPLNVDSKDVECERKRIKAEIRESSEKTSLDYFTNNIIWEGTPLKNMICGKTANLDRAGIKSLKSMQERILSKDNFFFYVTGNFEDDDIKYLIDSVSDYDIKDTHEMRNDFVTVPKCYFNRENNVFVKNNDYTYMRFSFDVDTTKYAAPQLDILFDILFKGENSVIYKELSEKEGLIYSFDWSFEQYMNVGNLYFVFEVRKNNLYDSIKKAINALKLLKKNLPRGLEYIKPRYVDNALIASDYCEDFNWERAYECHILNLDYKTIEDKKQKYINVTEEEILKISRDIFRKKNFVLTIKGDKKSIDIEKIKKITEELDNENYD